MSNIFRAMDLAIIKRNIWIINAIPVIIIQIISIPFYIIGDIFGVLMFSLLLLPIILTIINYRIGLLRLKIEFGRILLITLLASTFSFLLFFIPLIINLFFVPSEQNEIGFAWYVIFMLFTLIYTLILGLISFGFYKSFQRNDKLEGINSLMNIYEGTGYLIDLYKSTLKENEIESITRQLSVDTYGLFVEKKDFEFANEIIEKTAGNNL